MEPFRRCVPLLVFCLKWAVLFDCVELIRVQALTGTNIASLSLCVSILYSHVYCNLVSRIQFLAVE